MTRLLLDVLGRWDASQIYGDEKVHAESLRVEGKGGRMCEMRLDENGNLPIDPATGLPEGGTAVTLISPPALQHA